MNILIPMGGSDENFRKHGYVYAKPLIEIARRPMIEHALAPFKHLKDAHTIFIIRKEDNLRFYLGQVLHLLNPGATIMCVDGVTAGAACTALLAIEHINNDEELLIANGDQILDFDIEIVIARFRARSLDAGTVVFDSVHPRWSFVKTDENDLVLEAAEKRPISRNATAGVYYFRQGRFFVKAAQEMIFKDASVNGGFFVCPSLNELLLSQLKVGVERIDRSNYISLATPQSVEEYENLLKSKG
jgi:dTDP-glucose pyrophosphorylase